MDFSTAEFLRAAGFEGLVPINELISRLREVPQTQGVYAVVVPEGFLPNFLQTGTGGLFKGKDPNVSVSTLEKHWVREAAAIYIGKAGGSLRTRLRQYLHFGQGKPIGHYGGRFIWQIEDIDKLVVCWMTTTRNAREVERELISTFWASYGARPFANLVS